MDEFDTLTGLVSQYSPSGHERGAAAWLTARMKSLGYGDASIDGAGNAVGVVGQGPKQVVLLGHIDTVPGEITVRQEGPALHARLYGRGAVDAKGALASFVDAVARTGPRSGWQFVVIGAVQEESDSAGARSVISQYQPDFAIIGEPNHWDRVALGYKGSAWAQVTLKRKQAHSASGKETAAEAAVEIWLQIKACVHSFNADKQKAFDRLLLTLRGMASGANDFEQWARLTVGVRLPPEISPEAWYRQLAELLRDSHMESDCQLNVERIGFAVPAWVCEKNTKLVRAFLDGIRSQGAEPSFVYKMGTADLNIVAPAWKCPAVVYGPGDSALDHTPDEHIDLDDYRKAVSVLTDVLSKL